MDLRAFVDELRAAIVGEVRSDRLARAAYATDASIYEIIPDVVVFPTSTADVAAAVRVCAAHGVPITPRGAGTGLAGGTPNRGVQLDLSRHMNRVLHVDPQRRIARVQPGVVLDELNARLKQHGLHFSPDVATASRATIGGMIGNNSAGAHSIIVGRTCDHVLGVEAVLSDGSVARWGDQDGQGPAPPPESELARRCEATVARVLSEYADEIAERFPKVYRSNGAYALDRVRMVAGRPTIEQLIVGSEGTLGVVTAATLNLLPLPACKGLCVVHYHDLLEALGSVPALLEHHPAAVELLDKLILDGSKRNPAMLRRRWFLQGDPAAILIVEFFAEREQELAERLERFAGELRARGIGYAWPVLLRPEQQADVWEVRKAGTGILMSQPGDTQPYDFIDDCAVDPARLRDYIARLQQILRDEDIPRTGYYAHASVGLLHVRPALNLKTAEGVAKLRRIAERTAELVREFGGAMTGEHGEGLARSEWIPRLFGEKLVRAFAEIKSTFDPNGLFNPGKIVDPLPMDSNLRYGPGYSTADPPTMLDFSRHGSLAALAEMCGGLGECRKRLVGTMCPSYQATGDETATTRARANALRMALSNRGPLDGLADPALDEVFDLCLACKACRTECPTGTDVAKLKTEWLYHRNKTRGVPARSRMIARSIELAAWASRFAPLTNALLRSRAARVMLEHLYGFDRRMPLPAYAHETFREWFRRHAARRRALPAGAPRVVYFVDTWTNYYTPQVGRAAVKVLEALGCHVLVPETVCCGRPLISKGLLDEAKALAEQNVAVLGPLAREGLPIVGTEPSCVSVLLDELAQLVRSEAARRVAAASQTIETYLAARLRENPDALRFRRPLAPAIYHGHCHQKSLTGTADALAVLQAAAAGQASEIDSGCCGMAGAFGHEVEHYDVARAIGELRLFPAVRRRGEAEVLISGFSCRQHIEHHTDARPRHLIEYLADALGPGPGRQRQ